MNLTGNTRRFYAGDTYIVITTDDVAGMAGKFWDAGLVESIGNADAWEYSARMLTATAETLLWADTQHDCERAKETGDCEHRDVVRDGYAPDYEDALTPDDRAELESDVEGFIRNAWPYLSRDGITPEQAGHDFHLSRNGHGTGFWDRGYAHGGELHELAEMYGTFGVFFGTDDDGEITYVDVHH